MDADGSSGQGPPSKRRRKRPTLTQQNAALKKKMDELVVERDALTSELEIVREELTKSQLENDVVQVTSNKVEKLYYRVVEENSLPALKVQLDHLIQQGQQISAQIVEQAAPPRLQMLASIKVMQLQLARKDKLQQQLVKQMQDKDDTINVLQQTFANDVGEERQRRLDIELTLQALHTSMENMLLCSVCLGQWDCTGPHRVVALPCGHLYGEHCILDCLEQFGSCPQCRQTFTSVGLRRLYVNLSD